MSLLPGKKQFIGLLEKSLLMWFLFEGSHLVPTCQCEWLQEPEQKAMEGSICQAFTWRGYLSGQSCSCCAVWEVLNPGAPWAFISMKHSRLFMVA